MVRAFHAKTAVVVDLSLCYHEPTPSCYDRCKSIYKFVVGMGDSLVSCQLAVWIRKLKQLDRSFMEQWFLFS